jgi:omega-hydroxy-beta-dihydromenaquinone-9 sulfotransferase
LAVDNREPIIIVGTGRCGSTVFHHLLSKHSKLAWLPGALCRRFPQKPELQNLFNRGLDYPILGRVLGEGIAPAECYPFWEYHCRGFSAPYRDLVASDVTEKTKRRVRAAMSEITTEKRDRLLLKITGWPRIGFLSEIFEDAKFIHVIRDGRAVVNSMVNVYFWRGWEGPQDWGWGELSPAQKEEWERHDQSFVVLAALQWKILMDAVESAKTSLSKDNFLELKYEDLCSDPLDTFGTVTEFCGLKWTAGFEREIGKRELTNTNDRFKQDLTAQQQRDLEEVLGDYLRRYDYL